VLRVIPGLNVKGARIEGSVFSLGITATGRISLASAEIGGQLDCTTARFSYPRGRPIAGQRMQVGAQFFWQSVDVAAGDIHLPSADVGDLANWPKGGESMWTVSPMIASLGTHR